VLILAACATVYGFEHTPVAFVTAYRTACGVTPRRTLDT
jgi:hypothetical protein